jgi:tyrosyl-tRNA synthetase
LLQPHFRTSHTVIFLIALTGMIGDPTDVRPHVPPLSAEDMRNAKTHMAQVFKILSVRTDSLNSDGLTDALRTDPPDPEILMASNA